MNDTRLPRLERPFSNGLLAILVSDSAETFPLGPFANALVDAYGGDLVQKLGPFVGVDELYWDLRLRGHMVTLHREHYLGVFLCATDAQSEVLLQELLPFITSYLALIAPSVETE